MKLVVITGMPAAGKNIAAQYAKMRQYPHFSTGDFVRAEIRKRGCAGDAETSARISTEMRGEDGRGVTRLAIEEALKQKADVVFLEGIRSWPEIELIRSQATCMLIAVLAPRDLRLNRVTSRGREDDSVDHFDHRDQREIEYGVAVCIARADAYILNDGTLEDALRQLDMILQRL